jgi:glycosyltransferase involved in cell wall biosynthesis
MKFCFVTNGVVTRHATMKRAFGLAPSLRDLGHEVDFVIEEAEDNRRAAARVPGARVLTYDGSGSALAVRNRKERLAGAKRYDVVHVCGLGWRNAVRPERLSAALVVMDHVEIESTLRDAPRLRCWLQARLERWSFTAYDAHIGASRYLETWLRQRLFAGGSTRPLLWLSYANDYHGEIPGSEVIDAVRAAHGERKIVLYFGNFYREYGFWEMIEAAQRLAATRSDFRLVLAGRGPEQAAGEAFVRRHGLGEMIRFVGFIQGGDAIAHLHAAHALLVPLADTETDWARCPGKLFISMTSGRPIVTAPVGEGREHFHDHSFHYRPGDSASMAAVINRALDTPQGWKPNYSAGDHSWTARAEQWLRWVTPLVEESRR